MQLIQTNPNWSVQSLGREDIYAPQRVAQAKAGAAIAKGRLWGQAASTVSGILMDQYEKEQKRQLNDANFKRSQSVLAWEESVGQKEFYTSEEVDNSIEVPGSARDDNRIPSYMTKDKMWMQDSTKNILDIANGIDNPKIRDQWIKNQMLSANEQYVKYNISGNREQTQYIRAQEEGQIDVFIQQGDYASAREVAAQFNGTDLERQELIREINTKQEVSAYTQSMMDGDMRTMSQQIQYLQADDYDGELNLEQRYAKAKDLHNRMKQVESQANAALQKQYSEQVVDLGIRVNRGQATESQILDFNRRGLISDSQAISWVNKLDSVRAKENSAMDRVSMINQRRASGDIFDSTKDDAKDLNLWYDAMNFDLGNPEERTRAISFAAQDNILYDKMASRIRSRTRSENPEVVNDLMSFVAELKTTAPHAYEQLDNDIKQELQLYSQAFEGDGMITQRTIDMVTQAKKVDAGIKEVRDDRYNAGIKEKSIIERADKFIDKNMDTLGGLQPAQRDQLTRDFSSLLYTNYIATGDEEAATQRTWEMLLSSEYGYGVTSAGGRKRVMKNAPETDGYAEDQSDWIEADFDRFLSGQGYMPEEFTFDSDSQTVQESRQGMPKTYQVFDRMTGQPVYHTDEDTGRVSLLRWNPKERWLEAQRDKATMDMAQRKLKAELKDSAAPRMKRARVAGDKPEVPDPVKDYIIDRKEAFGQKLKEIDPFYKELPTGGW